MKSLVAFGIIVLCLLRMGGIAGAAVFNVSNSTEFQNALTTAATNSVDDTINVQTGAYGIALTLTYSPAGASEGSLTIQGAGAGATVLDGGGVTQILNIDTSGLGNDSGARITVSGMTFQNGDHIAGSGGGLFLFTNLADITVRDSEFINNSATYNGGAYIGSNFGAVTLTNNTFRGNSAALSDGGGALVGSTGVVTLTNNTFSGNTATNGSAGGARIVTLGNAALVVTNNTFGSNSAANGAGGGVGLEVNSLTFRDNIIRNNNSDLIGGGAIIFGSLFAITNNVFSGNSAVSGGGALVIPTDQAALINNTFINNSAVDNGGGLGVGLQLNTARADIYNNIIWGNTALTGGDLYVNDDGDNDGTGAVVAIYNNNFSFLPSRMVITSPRGAI